MVKTVITFAQKKPHNYFCTSLIRYEFINELTEIWTLLLEVAAGSCRKCTHADLHLT